MKEFPAVRRTQPITKKAKISSTTHVYCYNGYMVNNNNKPKLKRQKDDIQAKHFKRYEENVHKNFI